MNQQTIEDNHSDQETIETHKHKTILKKQLSTLVRCDTYFPPQWIGDNNICYGSPFQFTNYNVDDEYIFTLTRPETQPNIITAIFAKQYNQCGIEVVYIIKQQDMYYVCIVPSISTTKKPLVDKVHQKSIEEIYSIMRLQSNFILVRVKKNGKNCLILMCLLTNITQILELSQSIIDVKKGGDSHSLFIQTQSQLLLGYINFQNISIKVKTSFSLQQKSKILLMIEFTNSYIGILKNNKIKLLGVVNSKFIELTQLKINVKQVGGIVSNMKSILIWQKYEPIIYQYLFQEENIIYKNKIEFPLTPSSISNVILSEKNRNILIITHYNSLVKDFITFKLDLYTQLSSLDPQVYMKPLKYIFIQKKVQQLSLPKVGKKLYALTGQEVHSLVDTIMDGVLSFDVHPLGFYIIVSFGFSAKVYSLQNNNMSLIFSCSMYNIKKVRYNPVGSEIILFSSRQIKILDAFNFSLKYEIYEKNNSFLQLSFSQTKPNQTMYVITQSGCIYCYSTWNYKKVDTYKPFLSDKVISLRVDEQSKNSFYLTEKGNVIMKDQNQSCKTIIYSDRDYATAIQIDITNKILFVGTNAGKIRVHCWASKKCLQFFNMYNQSHIGFSQITCILLDVQGQELYVGNVSGNITQLKYTITNNIAFLNQSQQKHYNILPLQHYTLCSLSNSSQNEKNILQSKLQDIINKINEEIKESKNNYRDKYSHKQNKYTASTDIHQIYQNNKEKINSVQRSLSLIQGRLDAQKKQEKQKYEIQIKKVVKQQQNLRSRKFDLITNHVAAKNSIKSQYQQELENYQHQISNEQQNRSNTIKKAQITHKIPHEQIDFVPSLSIPVLKEVNSQLEEELKTEQKNFYQLRKEQIYLQTAKYNIVLKKSKESALEFRINRDIQNLSKTRQNFTLVKDRARRNLGNTQIIIEKIQSQMNPDKSKKNKQGKYKTDVCAYKLYLKDKGQNQLIFFIDKLKEIEYQLQIKRNQLIEENSRRQKNQQLENKLKSHLENLKNTLKKKRQTILNQQYHLNTQKEDIFEKSHHNRFGSQQQKAIYEVDRFNISYGKSGEFLENNMKVNRRKVHKLNKENTHLLNQYLRLKYQNKQFVDKKNELQQAIKIVLQELEKYQNLGVRQQNMSQRASAVVTPFQTYHNSKPSLKTCRSYNHTPHSSAVLNSKKSNRINMSSTNNSWNKSIRLHISQKTLTKKKQKNIERVLHTNFDSFR